MQGKYNRGDTLVEMVLAFAIFSLAAVAALAIMNRGIAISQHSLETTLVRQQMDGQAEMVRYLRDTSSSVWDTVKAHAVNTVVAPLSPATCPDAGAVSALGSNKHGFFITKDDALDTFVVHDIDGTNFSQPSTYARVDQVNAKTQGLWVQVAEAESNGKPVKAYDVYIHACWDSVALKNVPATLGTIVRVYDK